MSLNILANGKVLSLDANGNLLVNIAAGSISGGNAAASLTGAAVPTSADYQGVKVSGNLVGVTGLSLGSSVAPTVAIVDASGNQITSFGGGTQYANGAAVATPTGTAALGWDGTDVRVLSTNSSGQLNVIFPSAQSVTVSGTVAVTQSGTWNVTVNTALPAGTNVIGHVIADSGSTTVVTGTVTISGTVTANIGTSGSLALDASVTGLQVSQGSTTSGQKLGLIGGAVTTGAPTYTTTQTSPLSLDTSGNLRIVGAVSQSGTWNIGTVAAVTAITNALPAGTNVIGHVIADSGSTTVVTGTVAVTQSGSWSLAANQSVNVAQINGVTPLMGNGVTGTGSQRVTIASDNTAFSVNAIQSGTWNIGTVAAVTAITNALPAGTNVIGHVIVDSGSITATVSGTVTANQGSPNTLANKWPVQVTDGTNVMPTGDSSARTIHVTTDNSTIAVTQSGAPWSQNITQINGVALALGQTTMANSIPVVIASDQSTLSVSGGGGSSTSVDTIVEDNTALMLLELRTMRELLTSMVTESGTCKPGDFNPADYGDMATSEGAI